MGAQGGDDHRAREFFFFSPVVDTTWRGGFWIGPILFLDLGTAFAETPTNPPGAEPCGDGEGHASRPNAPAWVASRHASPQGPALSP